MTDQTVADQEPVTHSVRRFVSVLAILGALLAFGAWTYQGLIYWLAEWQFEHFSLYFPTLTIIVLLTLVALLWAFIGAIRRRLRRKRDPNSGEEEQMPELRTLARLGFSRRFFRTFALIAAVGALGTFIHYLQLPSATKEVTVVDLASTSPSNLREGSVDVRGIVPIGPIAWSSEDIILWRSSIYLAPVGQTTLENGTGAANLFVQVNSPERRRVPSQMKGVLRRNALPSEVAVMYRAAEFPVMSNSAIVFVDADTGAIPTLHVLLTFVLLAIVGGLFFLFARRRQRKFAKELAEKRQVRPATG